MKTYCGMRYNGICEVVVNEHGLRKGLLAPRLDLRNHSPTGFEWGYGGSGPAQLALAILADHGDEEQALLYYQDFKSEVISQLPHATWALTSQTVQDWLDYKFWEGAES